MRHSSANSLPQAPSESRNGEIGKSAAKGPNFYSRLRLFAVNLHRACLLRCLGNLESMRQPTYSCVRIKKIRTATDARNAYRHGARIRGSFGKSAVDLRRSHLNQHFTFNPDAFEFEQVAQCPDYREEIEARRVAAGARRPKNGTFATEVMFTASPSLFKSDDGSVDLERARSWARACLDISQEKYGNQCIAARLDLDETTPHLSVFILPMYEKTYGGANRRSSRKPRRTVSHNKVFGGPDDLRKMQDWAAVQLKAKGFDVVRGRPVEETKARNFQPDGRRHEDLQKMQEALKEKEEKLNAILKALKIVGRAFRAEEQKLSPSMRGLLRQLLSQPKIQLTFSRRRGERKSAPGHRPPLR